MRVALDTNVLAYAEGVNGSERRDAALTLVRRLPQAGAVIPVQVLGELFNVLVRKARKSRTEARDALLSWRDAFPVVETSTEVMLAAGKYGIGPSTGNMGCSHSVDCLAMGLPPASVGGPSGRLYLGWSDGGQSILLASARSAACPVGEGCRMISAAPMRMIRQAISPRLAITISANMGGSGLPLCTEGGAPMASAS